MASYESMVTMARLNNKAQLAAWEAMIIIVLIGYGAYMTYLWASKTTETKVFQKGSNARIFEPSSHFGCSNIKVDEFMQTQRNEVKK